MLVSEWILTTVISGCSVLMNSSMRSANFSVEFPVTEWVQFLGVPTPVTRISTFFKLSLGLYFSLMRACHRGSSVDKSGKKIALIRVASVDTMRGASRPRTRRSDSSSGATTKSLQFDRSSDTPTGNKAAPSGSGLMLYLGVASFRS